MTKKTDTQLPSIFSDRYTVGLRRLIAGYVGYLAETDITKSEACEAVVVSTLTFSALKHPTFTLDIAYEAKRRSRLIANQVGLVRYEEWKRKRTNSSSH